MNLDKESAHLKLMRKILSCVSKRILLEWYVALNRQTKKIKAYICERLYSIDTTMSMG